MSMRIHSNNYYLNKTLCGWQTLIYTFRTQWFFNLWRHPDLHLVPAFSYTFGWFVVSVQNFMQQAQLNMFFPLFTSELRQIQYPNVLECWISITQRNSNSSTVTMLVVLM